jgi:hypothetical protein
MALRRRTHKVTFRVSEHELEALKLKSEAEGARSVSDFARLALCGSPEDGYARNGARVPREPGIDHLSHEIQQLSAHVRRVTEILEKNGKG